MTKTWYVNLGLSLAIVIMMVGMGAHFGSADPSLRIQAGIALGILIGCLVTRVWARL